MMTNCAATVYNKFVQGGAEKYQRASLTAVAWENKKASNVVRSGLLAADSAVVYVPFSLGASHVNPVAFLATTILTGATTSGSKVISGLSSTAGLQAGMAITGTGIGAGSVIATIDSTTQVTGTVNSTATGTVSITFYSGRFGKWTLAVGDYLVKGLVADEITTGFSVTNLKAKYDDVVQAKSVDTFDMGSASLRHWKVSAQ